MPARLLARPRADAATRFIPVVAVSVDATGSQQERLAASATTYLTKPIDVPEFLRVVRQT